MSRLGFLGRLSETKQGTDDYNQAIDELNNKLKGLGMETLDYAASNEKVAEALKALGEEAALLKILGSYPKAIL